jgi:Na+/H+ antiporter NhaD/arsenite permease-like protein
MDIEFAETMMMGIAYILVAVLIVFALYFVYRKRKLLSEEIRLAIEKGQPYELPKREVNFYLHGILWTIVGVLAFVALLLTTSNFGLSIFGLLPAALGVAFLAVHRKAQREQQ